MPLTLATAHATRPRVGETANGDAAIVRRHGELVLLAVVDALGHGPDAERAALLARAYFDGADLASSIEQLFEGVHRALAGSRGAAVTACVFDGACLRGAGVGNVTLRALGPTPIAALLTPGIVGGPHRARVRTFAATLVEGDRFALFSDGVSPTADWDTMRGPELERAAFAVLLRAARPHDDATVLLAQVCRRE